MIKEIAEKELAAISWKILIERWSIAVLEKKYNPTKMDQNTFRDNSAQLDKKTSNWMNLPADSICPADVDDLFEQLKEAEYSTSRLRALKGAINSVFRFGQQERLIDHRLPLPTINLKIGKKLKRGRADEVLGEAGLTKLLSNAKVDKPEWFPVWFMAVHCGMRSGELQALVWSHIDFESGNIHISKSWNTRNKCVKDTKTGENRTIPLHPAIRNFLLELREKSNARDVDFVLPRLSPWFRGEAAKHLRSYCEALKITSVCLHTLRACFTTYLLQNGKPQSQVQKLGGWRNLKTMEHYVRKAGISVKGATDPLDRVGVGYENDRVAQLPENVIQFPVTRRVVVQNNCFETDGDVSS